MREATDADLPAISELDYHVRECPSRRRSLEKSISDRACIVATLGTKVVGHGVLDHSFFERGFISTLYVHSDHRRRGAGTGLVRALEARCETFQLFTSTNASNVPMQTLLTKLGYSPSGIIHNLDPGDPEIVYVKALTKPT